MITESQTLVYAGIDNQHVPVVDHLDTPLQDIQVPATSSGYCGA